MVEEHDPSGLADCSWEQLAKPLDYQTEAFGGCAMDNATDDDLDQWDLDQGLEISISDEKSSQNRRGKKRRRALRKNRKPSRPANYIGQRSNNHLLQIFSEKPARSDVSAE